MDRRLFVQSSAAALAYRGRAAAADVVNVAIVGMGGRGRDLLAVFGAQRGVRIAAVCDIDLTRLDQAVRLVQQGGGGTPSAYQDVRRLLEDKQVDAVVIATCNHWHALASIWSCQAGKDVYVEKPASHNIREGRRMVEAARQYGRIVQVGTQGRSVAHKRRAIQLLREGIIGHVYLAKGLCFKRRLSIGKAPAGPVPPGVDYDLWLGPAEWRDFQSTRFHYNWHWFWDTGNGDIGNQGAHQMDIARWGLGVSGLPGRVFSSGARFLYDDDQETPNTQQAVFDYDDCQLMFEVRGLLTAGEGDIAFEGGNFIGNLFLGSRGVMALDEQGFRVYDGEKRELIQEMKRVERSNADPVPHVANFLEVVRSRRVEDLAADIEEGHISAALCHLANISYRTGRSLAVDPQRECFVQDEAADAFLTRAYRAPFQV